MLYVDPGSVANWIDRGKLNAYRTPGGHRRVAVGDLVVFLNEHKMPVPEQLDATPRNILVVDDDAAVARLVARAVQAVYPDCEVLQAHDGFRAGTIIASRAPDVVILDLRMPGVDGYEVCRLIKSQNSPKRTEVLAITAYPSPENEQRILACGARTCLAKPLDIDVLLKEVGDALSGDTSRSRVEGK